MLSDALSVDDNPGAFALEILPSPSEDFLRKTARRSLAIAIMCGIAMVLIVVLSSYSRLPVRAWLGDYDTALAVSAIFPALGAYHYHNVYRRSKQGMEGEKRVIEFLKSKFGDDYFLINNIVYINERGNTPTTSEPHPDSNPANQPKPNSKSGTASFW